MSTFSYAQAAKGNSGTPTPSKTPSEPEKIDTPAAEQTSTETTTEAAPAPVETEAPQKADKAVTEEKDDDFTTVTNKHAAKSKALTSRTSSPNVRTGSKSRKSKEDDSSNTANGSTETSEKQAPSEGQTEKAEGAAEKSNDKSEDSEKNVPPKELKAAPLPSVNIWQQRREAQDLKVKTVPKSAATGKAATTKVASNADETQQDSSKASTKKKGTENAPEGTKDRKKTEGGKGRDAVPSVEDSTAWPTPQVAIGEDKKKAQEKTDKSPVIRPHGKEKWTPVPYVPTAVFNTPLPSAGGRGGRRATRGGRDGGRGAHGNGAAGADKAASGQAAQGTKQASGERGRQESGTGRATSLPAQSRRSTSTDAGAAADARKATQATERSRGARNGEENTNGKQVNGGENAPRPQREGKPFGRNQDARQKGGNLAVDSQAAARSNDRRFEAGSKSADPTGFNDFSRERGEFRSERGSRGSNRGRGGPYSNFGGQNAQFGNHAMSNNSFAASKSFGFNDRQRSQHALPNGAQQGNRMPLRSPSLPNSGNVYGVYPFPGDINPMYGYPAVNAAPMTAMPYQQYMEPYALLNMLSMQLEYYFSVDNMCKDMFLRKQMDSQGFVPLNVLASFKRVKSLTEDFELLRHVARQLRTVEYQIGEDGVDRLRTREHWEQWVLPFNQREPAAQHDGAAPTGITDENTPINAPTETTINGSAPQFVPNGSAKTSLSSTAPEFMPSLPPTAGSEITNVGYPMESPVSPLSLEDPTASPLLFAPYPLDCSNVDENLARGLDMQSGSYFPCDLAATVGPMSSSAENFPSQAGGAGHRPGKSSAKSHHRKAKPQGKGRSFTETLNYVPKSFDVSRGESYSGGGQSVARRPSFENPQSYESWSSSLAQNFDFDLYNDFRRSALDDLLTRHVDHGFNALMDFYRNILLGSLAIPDSVMNDLVHLSRKESDSHTIVSDMIHQALASKDMTSKNQKKVNKYFNTQHGKTPEEKLPC